MSGQSLVIVDSGVFANFRDVNGGGEILYISKRPASDAARALHARDLGEINDSRTRTLDGPG